LRLFGLDIRRTEAAPERRDTSTFTLAELSESGGWSKLLDQWNATAGPGVTIDSAMSVPAVWAGVNFLSNLIASLPFHEFKRVAGGGRERVSTGMIAGMLSGTVNDEGLTEFKWRKNAMVSVLLTGAGRTWVEKDAGGNAINLWPLETAKTTKFRKGGQVGFRYRLAGGKTVTYDASEVIDLTFVDQLDGVGAFDPVKRLRDTISLALALQQYASRFFSNGGVPPLALHTPLGSPGAQARAKTDTNEAIRRANAERSNILLLPIGTDLKAIGIDPDKGQLVAGQRFVIEELARLWGLPPVFLQDLTHGTYTNTEQQDLHLSKHTATAWVRQLESECNARFYKPRQTSRFVELILDGLQRGDFKSRTEGLARAIQTGQLTPNEARALENRPAMPGGDRLLIQGATLPLEDAGKAAPPAPGLDPDPAPPADPEDPEKEPADVA
jgi:HK97 family phage portal protein